MQTLYPQIKPYARHDLAVDETHTLYVDESGSPEGLPVVFIHGGPGAGCDAQSRCYFDPNLYRIVTFDQRGCGRSTPHASLENNTTWDLVADLERIRKHLGIEKWVLFGGSLWQDGRAGRCRNPGSPFWLCRSDPGGAYQDHSPADPVNRERDGSSAVSRPGSLE